MTYKYVNMGLECLSYPENVRRGVITGTIGPLGNGRISWIQLLSVSQRQIPTKNHGSVTRERLTNLSSLRLFPPEGPDDFVDLSYCYLHFSFLNM